MRSLGTFVRDRRTALGLQQEDIAHAVGIDTSKVSRLENDLVRQFLSPDELRALARVLAVTVEELLIAAGYLDAPEQEEQEETDDERLARMVREVEQHHDPHVRRIMLDTFRLAQSIERARRDRDQGLEVIGL